MTVSRLHLNIFKTSHSYIVPCYWDQNDRHICTSLWFRVMFPRTCVCMCARAIACFRLCHASNILLFDKRFISRLSLPFETVLPLLRHFCATFCYLVNKRCVRVFTHMSSGIVYYAFTCMYMYASLVQPGLYRFQVSTVARALVWLLDFRYTQLTVCWIGSCLCLGISVQCHHNGLVPGASFVNPYAHQPGHWFNLTSLRTDTRVELQ